MLGIGPGTVVGGLIAGGVGWAASRDAIRKRQEIEEQNWRGQLDQLTGRLKFEYGEATRVAPETEDQQQADIETLEFVFPELERHLGNAPILIPEEVRESQREMLSAYSRLGQHPIGHHATVNRLKTISAQASAISSEFDLNSE